MKSVFKFLGGCAYQKFHRARNLSSSEPFLLNWREKRNGLLSEFQMTSPLIEIEEPSQTSPRTTRTVRRATEVNRKWNESGGETLVAMMQAAGLRDFDHLSDSARHDRAWVGAILIERKVGAGSMIVVDIRRQDAAQMALVEDHNVIQTLATNRA